MQKIRLIRDLLDNQLLDVTEQNAGKVDGIVLELRDGRPPRVAYAEVGPVTAARRLSERFGRWIARIDRRWGPERGRPFRIPISRISGFGIDLRLDFRAEETPIFAAERWLRKHVVARIPGSR